MDKETSLSLPVALFCFSVTIEYADDFVKRT